MALLTRCFSRATTERQQQRDNWEPLCDDDLSNNDGESCCTSISGESMANDADEVTEEFHIEAKDKTMQLRQGHQLESLLVDVTTMSMYDTKVVVSTTSNGAAKNSVETHKTSPEAWQSIDDYLYQIEQPSSSTMKKSSSVDDNIACTLTRPVGRNVSRRNAVTKTSTNAFDLLGKSDRKRTNLINQKRIGYLSTSEHGTNSSKKASLATRKRGGYLSISEHGTKGATITTTKKTQTAFDLLGKSDHNKKKSSLTTGTRGCHRSISEHGTNGSSVLRRCPPASRRVTRSKSSGVEVGHRQRSRSLSRHVSRTNTEDANDATNTVGATTNEKKVRQLTGHQRCSVKPPRRSKSTTRVEIDAVSSMARNTYSNIALVAADTHDPTVFCCNNKIMQCSGGVSSSDATNTTITAEARAPDTIGVHEYNNKDIQQIYEQRWNSASCVAVVNDIRTSHALSSLERNTDMDTAAQKHAEAFAQQINNDDYVVMIDYLGHVLCGPTVIEMHMAAMMKQQEQQRSSPPAPSNVQSNILNPNIRTMGVGVAKGANGLLYVCELFHVL